MLISPTTKTFPIKNDKVILCDTIKDSIEHEPQTGIQCLGRFNNKNGKLEALPEHVLADLIPHYDIVLMEADGSRWLSCKGWSDSEPVVPAYSTHTVGVATIDVLGKTATDKTVHHLPEFLSLTGLSENDIITEKVLEDMICLPGGMFKNYSGNQYLLINKIESKKSEYAGKTLLENIRINHLKRFKRLICGSIQKNVWYEWN